ncbi:MAG: hypothetical protein G01um10148_1063 [Parcubacteria group bacterium Gr01-1014_8]|nr:MAG: hypothetical protein G01um10148_1063 [Parcubacteria group bacterium Gr01-1014_8]
MDTLRASGAEKQKAMEVAARAAFGELEEKLAQLGKVSEEDLWSYGVPTGDSRDAIRRLVAIREVVARHKPLAEKPELLGSEAEKFVQWSSTFSNAVSYLNYLLGKRDDTDTFQEKRKEESAKWTSVVAAHRDITTLLNSLAEQKLQKYSAETILGLSRNAETLVEEARNSSEQRDGALKSLQDMLGGLRKDALTAQYEREHADDFPHM